MPRASWKETEQRGILTQTEGFITHADCQEAERERRRRNGTGIRTYRAKLVYCFHSTASFCCYATHIWDETLACDAWCLNLKISAAGSMCQQQSSASIKTSQPPLFKTPEPTQCNVSASKGFSFFFLVHKVITVLFFCFPLQTKGKRGELGEFLSNNNNGSIVIKPLTCWVFTSINHSHVLLTVYIMVEGAGGVVGFQLQKSEAKSTGLFNQFDFS